MGITRSKSTGQSWTTLTHDGLLGTVQGPLLTPDQLVPLFNGKYPDLNEKLYAHSYESSCHLLCAHSIAWPQLEVGRIIGVSMLLFWRVEL